jgi:hypothetical protein
MWFHFGVKVGRQLGSHETHLNQNETDIWGLAAKVEELESRLADKADKK